MPVLLLFSGQASAAGGEMPSLVQDIGISLLTAGLIALIFTRLRIPSIAAFLVAGVLVGPLGLQQVTNPENIDTIADEKGISYFFWMLTIVSLVMAVLSVAFQPIIKKLMHGVR